MNFKVEQCRFMEGLNYVSTFAGKGKVNMSEPLVEMEIVSINPAKLKLTCNNNGVWGTAEVDLLYADEVGVMPHLDAKKLVRILRTIRPTMELIFGSVERINANEEKVSFATLFYTGRLKPIEFIQDQSIMFPAPNMDGANIYSIEGATLKKGVKCINSLIKRNENNLIFNSINMTLAPGGVLFEGIDSSTNTFINAMYSSNNKHQMKTFFDAQKASLGVGFFDEAQPVKIMLTNNFVAFEQNGLCFYIQLYNGSFINTTQYMPKQYAYKYTFDKYTMMNCLERIDAMVPSSATMRTCEVEFSGMLTTIKSINALGSNTEQCPSTSKGVEKVVKVFNLDTFIKVLKQMPNGPIDAIIYENGYVNLQHSSKTDILKCLVSPLSREVKQVKDKDKKGKKDKDEDVA